MPVIVGHKSPNERFAGAEDTLTIEALMQDGKALQSGTSHFLGQNFAKAFDVQYVNKEGKLEYVWATSWGVSTRLMGALIMAHSDNNGLVLPPRLAPIQVVMIPIYKGEEQLVEIRNRFEKLAAELRAKGISVKIDDRDNVPQASSSPNTSSRAYRYVWRWAPATWRTAPSSSCAATRSRRRPSRSRG